ncbi:MAG: hypothetical protein FWH53_04095 [Leptospirales bacterium]|nr:hypothetical protein [Leptospirales bacterium]
MFLIPDYKTVDLYVSADIQDCANIDNKCVVFRMYETSSDNVISQFEVYVHEDNWKHLDDWKEQKLYLLKNHLTLSYLLKRVDPVERYETSKLNYNYKKHLAFVAKNFYVNDHLQRASYGRINVYHENPAFYVIEHEKYIFTNEGNMHFKKVKKYKIIALDKSIY